MVLLGRALHKTRKKIMPKDKSLLRYEKKIRRRRKLFAFLSFFGVYLGQCNHCGKLCLCNKFVFHYVQNFIFHKKCFEKHQAELYIAHTEN